jgi:hypothetical protein
VRGLQFPAICRFVSPFGTFVSGLKNLFRSYEKYRVKHGEPKTMGAEGGKTDGI